MAKEQPNPSLAEEAASKEKRSSLLAFFNEEGLDRKLAILDKILSRCVEVQKIDMATPCLLWEGPCSGNGRGGNYGRFSFDGKTSSVHRTVWAVINGPIPPKKQIDHKCNDRRCCQPDHLQLTTHKKNQKLRDERNQK